MSASGDQSSASSGQVAAAQRRNGADAQAALSSSTTALEDQRVATATARAQLIPGALCGRSDPEFRGLDGADWTGANREVSHCWGRPTLNQQSRQIGPGVAAMPERASMRRSGAEWRIDPKFGDICGSVVGLGLPEAFATRGTSDARYVARRGPSGLCVPDSQGAPGSVIVSDVLGTSVELVASGLEVPSPVGMPGAPDMSGPDASAPMGASARAMCPASMRPARWGLDTGDISGFGVSYSLEVRFARRVRPRCVQPAREHDVHNPSDLDASGFNASGLNVSDLNVSDLNVSDTHVVLSPVALSELGRASQLALDAHGPVCDDPRMVDSGTSADGPSHSAPRRISADAGRRELQ